MRTAPDHFSPHRSRLPAALLTASLSLGLLACFADFEDPDEEYGMNGPLEPTPPPGKDDSMHRKGLPVSVDSADTQVWAVKNQWEDTDTADARKAGLAWGEDSGLTWDEKFGLWVQSMRRTRGHGNFFDTFILTTPWGKELPSPALECAELSLFLRISFAAWYQLPIFFEAVDSSGARVYFGHFGVRTAAGRYQNTPRYKSQFKDHSNLSEAEYTANWPSDAGLRNRKLFGGVDEQPMLGPSAVFGTYLDEIHLNKRVGHFTALTLNYLGSVNLADTANTYNIVAEVVRAGDTLVQRWQRRGIGHTVVVKESVEAGEGTLDVTVLSGSMPRRQGKWESGVASKGYFTSPFAGGLGENSDGQEYVKLGGGIKRYRVAKKVGGSWTNTFMRADEAHWINSTHFSRIAERPGIYDRILGQVSPEELREALLDKIDDARGHLRRFPASCAARDRREKAFAELYELMEREFATTRAQVDAAHRLHEDYVLAELEYSKSKTCCWNSTTEHMFEIIMDFAREEAEASPVCQTPTVFMSHADGYRRWRDLAQATGRAAQWRAWSEDESCPQRAVAADTEREHEWTEFCALGPPDQPPACGDVFDGNHSMADAVPVGPGTIENLRICPDGRADWFLIEGGGTVIIRFSHATGDLDMTAFDASGAQIGSSISVTDEERLTVPPGARVKVYGFSGATGPYSLTVM